MLKEILKEIQNEGLLDKIKNKWNFIKYKLLNFAELKPGYIFFINKKDSSETIAIVALEKVDFDNDEFVLKTLWGKNFDGIYGYEELYNSNFDFLWATEDIVNDEPYNVKNIKPLINLIKLLEKGPVKAIVKKQKEFRLKNSKETMTIKKGEVIKIISSFEDFKNEGFTEIVGEYNGYELSIYMNNLSYFKYLEFVRG